MVNFGPLAAEIGSLVWGTPGNFNGLRFLAALLHGTLVVGVSQTAALNRGRHLYSAGRPSRLALAHTSSWYSKEGPERVSSECTKRSTVPSAASLPITNTNLQGKVKCTIYFVTELY